MSLFPVFRTTVWGRLERPCCGWPRASRRPYSRGCVCRGSRAHGCNLPSSRVRTPVCKHSGFIMTQGGMTYCTKRGLGGGGGEGLARKRRKKQCSSPWNVLLQVFGPEGSLGHAHAMGDPIWVAQRQLVAHQLIALNRSSGMTARGVKMARTTKKGDFLPGNPSSQ